MGTTKAASDALVAVQTAEAETRVAELHEVSVPEEVAYPAADARPDAYTERAKANQKAAGLA